MLNLKYIVILLLVIFSRGLNGFIASAGVISRVFKSRDYMFMLCASDALSSPLHFPL
jgi:hypothetical protein